MVCAMNPSAFERLARLPIVPYYETAFRQATGVSLKLVPPESVSPQHSLGHSESAFCVLATSLPAGCAACLEAEQCALGAAARKLSLQQLHCYAGLTVVAVPVIICGSHVATMLSGRIFRREPTERDFLMVVKMLGGGPGAEWVRRARRAYFDTPVLSTERFQAVLQLLKVFAQYLAEVAGRHALAWSEAEPAAVSNAKRFVQAHVDDSITLSQVIEHVHVSRFYFCKLFKKATGMTLTEYVAQARVEKAKELLLDSSLRVSEVVFAAGFGSVARFNSVFKRHVGMAPTEFRASSRPQPPL
jgi:AraC-like DNA-binding protein